MKETFGVGNIKSNSLLFCILSISFFDEYSHNTKCIHINTDNSTTSHCTISHHIIIIIVVVVVIVIVIVVIIIIIIIVIIILTLYLVTLLHKVILSNYTTPHQFKSYQMEHM